MKARVEHRGAGDTRPVDGRGRLEVIEPIVGEEAPAIGEGGGEGGQKRDRAVLHLKGHED